MMVREYTMGDAYKARQRRDGKRRGVRSERRALDEELRQAVMGADYPDDDLDDDGDDFQQQAASPKPRGME
jgi:hypothetical protein